MKYISTRQAAPILSFKNAVLQGLAADGGLYLPEFLPLFSTNELCELATLNYQDLAYKIIKLFSGEELDKIALKEIINKSYKNFSHNAIAPLKQLDHNQYLLELFHCPTLAFKDFALQFLGNLFNYFLEQDKQKIVIIGATSGDTGSSAIIGCKQCQHAKIFILHPHNLIAEIQRKQMTTISDVNVHNIAIRGNFDDCQALVKKIFASKNFLTDHKIVAVNSINWARIAAQIIYYFYAALNLGAGQNRQISFCVPTGNFGNIYAGFLAKKMGIPINKLIIATNSNDILTRFIKDNDYSRKNVFETLSPSMNIAVASNFERLLFNVYHSQNRGQEVAMMMKDFEITGKLKIDGEILEIIRNDFESHSINDQENCQLIAGIYHQTGEMLDPHSAVGVGAMQKYIAGDSYQNEPVISIATAHPAKFPEAIQKAGLEVPKLPSSLQDLINKKERMEILDNDLEGVKKFIGEIVGRDGRG